MHTITEYNSPDLWTFCKSYGGAQKRCVLFLFLPSIASSSDGVSSSLSARRGQLEKLNGAKKNLTKLQFLTELPARLQRYVREEELEQAVADYRKARRILGAVGHVSAFSGIQEEATFIMRRLSQALSVRLQQLAPPNSPGATIRLLLHLEGGERAHLTDYLARSKRALHEVLTSSAAPADDDDGSAALAGAENEDGADEGEGEGEGGAAAEVARLGGRFVPRLIELHEEWQGLFMRERPPPALESADAAPALTESEKEEMELEAMHELVGGFIEMCRRSLAQEGTAPSRLLGGIRQLVASLEPLHELVPNAKLMQRATRAAEALAKRSMDDELGRLHEGLAALVGTLREAGGSLPTQLSEAGAQMARLVQEALSSVAPLLVPLCGLLGLRADGMAKHLVSKLYAAILSVAKACDEPTPDAGTVLVRAGFCLQMVAVGVPQVPAMLKAQLSSHGLGGAALGFDSAAMSREMQRVVDSLLERFVEMQAQQLSLEVSRRMHSTNWLTCPPPRDVTHLVEATMLQLRRMASLASQVLPGEPPRSLLPSTPFPTASSLVQLAPQRSRGADAGGASSLIQKDLQRMFARKVSFTTPIFGAGGKPSVSAMLTHVAKLTLKTLVEEVRLATFSRAGFQQVQLDCAMLRWVLPPVVDDDGAISSLLDEALISCQERCFDCVAVEHSVMEALCEAKRKELRLSLA